MARKERRWLVAEIRNQLLPTLHEQGFESLALTDAEAKGELHQGYPFGRLRRCRAGFFDLAEIAMDKHGDPSFCISFGRAPKQGIQHPAVGYVAASELWSSHLPQHYALYQIPLLLRQFVVQRWPWQQVSQAHVHEMVAKISTFAPLEINAALVEGRCGRHVRRCG